MISIGALEAHDLRGTLGEDILKMFSDSLVVLKGIRRNNLYYLKDSAVTEIWQHQNVWIVILPCYGIQD